MFSWAGDSKKTPWWLTGLVTATIFAALLFVWLLWLYDWEFFQQMHGNISHYEEITPWLIAFFLCFAITVFLSIYIGSRAKNPQRVTMYAFIIFLAIILVEGGIFIGYMTCQFTHWQF